MKETRFFDLLSIFAASIVVIGFCVIAIDFPSDDLKLLQEIEGFASMAEGGISSVNKELNIVFNYFK